jgi:thymidine kinase
VPAAGASAEAVITRAALDLAAHLGCAPDSGLDWVSGPKASGKTLVGVTLMEHWQAAGRRAVAVQPHLQRAEITLGRLVSRAGPACEAHPYRSSGDLRRWLAAAHFAVFDELQFTPDRISAAVGQAVIEFIARGGRAVVTGLSHTSARQEFPLFAQLRPYVREWHQLRAVCTACGQPSAVFTQRMVDGRPAPQSAALFLPPSERVTYEPRCPVCYRAA